MAPHELSDQRRRWTDIRKMAEPLSVQIARKRGCEPEFVIRGEKGAIWRCRCRRVSHSNFYPARVLWEARATVDGPYEYESWLGLDAIWTLFWEIVKAGREGDPAARKSVDRLMHGGVRWTKAKLPTEEGVRFMTHEVAAAWLSWKEESGGPP